MDKILTFEEWHLKEFGCESNEHSVLCDRERKIWDYKESETTELKDEIKELKYKIKQAKEVLENVQERISDKTEIISSINKYCKEARTTAPVIVILRLREKIAKILEVIEKREKLPWRCSKCNQVNTGWATECGRCSSKIQDNL